MALAAVKRRRKEPQSLLGKQTVSDVFVTALLAFGFAFLVVIGHARLALAVVVHRVPQLFFME